MPQNREKCKRERENEPHRISCKKLSLRSQCAHWLWQSVLLWICTGVLRIPTTSLRTGLGMTCKFLRLLSLRGRKAPVAIRSPRPYAFIPSSPQKKRWPGGHLCDCRKTRRVFPTKGLRSAARIICPSVTDKFHTGSPSCIFSHAHVARENDFISLPPAGGKLCEAFLTR